MPFVLVDLGAFAVAGLCLLAAIALTYIIKAIASALPNLSILGVGLDLAKIFRDAGDSIVNWVVDNTKQFWHDLESWVAAHAYLLDTFAGAVVQAVSHLGDQIAHITTEVVPNAIRAAEAQAGKELNAAINGVETAIADAYHSTANALTGVDRQIYEDVAGIESTIANNLKAAVSHAVDTAESYTDTAIGDLRKYVDKSVSDAESIASKALADARTQIGAAIAGVASTAASDLATAENTLEAQISAAARTAASDLATAEKTIGGEITGAEQQASAALNQAVGSLTGEISSAESTLQGEIGQAVGTLTGDIASEAQAFAGDLSNLQSVLQAAIAASIAGVVARVAKLEECSVGVCEDSPNNFSNLLQNALGLISLAGVGEFLATAIDHPADATSEFADTIEGLYQTGQDAFHQLLNL